VCGICGILGDPPPGSVEAMAAAMRHRGPDDSGVFRDGRVALAMDRLAIIDVTPGGHQPMGNADGSVWIVYNGETYNFRSEREELAAKGHRFASASDTEVVLRLYEQHGDAFLARLRGMFALAVYDRRGGPGRERLLLARDPLGIKPLLYARSGGRFIFASEMKALLASGLVERTIDPESLRLLLSYGSVNQPATAVAGVRMLLPGRKLVVEDGGERIEPYWTLGVDRREGLRGQPYERLVEEVQAALYESVRLQMVSDVPVGAFLSGGVDSSLLVALMSRAVGRKVKTFSVGFGAEGTHLDETDDAERAARFIGTDHTRVVVTGPEVRDRILHIASALDQPSVDGVNSYFVSLAARSAVTVAISGTGGDELFAGYPWFRNVVEAAARDARRGLRGVPGRIASAAARLPLFDSLASGPSAGAVERIRGASGLLPGYAREYRIFDTGDAARALSPWLRRLTRAGREPSRDIQPEELPAAPAIERVSALCLRGYTQNQLLRDIDAVSMAHSLEVRVPFLDPVVVDLALSLPADAKLGRVGGPSGPGPLTYRESGAKRILIDAGRGLLPDGMDLQPKRGFGMPFGAWLAGPLRDVLDDALSDASVRRRGLFDAREVQAHKDRFAAGRDSWPKVWLLMMVELWCREVLDRAPAPAAR
jgi:asparagine synthase (glutamine-hydrolysing)